ncbi:MAG: MFS transporter [Sphaerochaeta sp.]
MDDLKKKEILKDRQITKFRLYGFFKNLKFFEPFLLVFLLANNLNLLQIGFLISIREIIVNVFEIPSGIIADYFGKKKELYMCFLFYVISFIIFFFTRNFLIAAVAMVFYGLGEAFRSGSHKALIYNYLDMKEWTSYKTFVYGRTRSTSLVGSAISSLLAIVFILNIPSTNYIFLASIIPYLIDFFLILSYPAEIDSIKITVDKFSFRDTCSMIFKDILSRKKLRRLVAADSMYEAAIVSIKDYIQPILQVAILSSAYFSALKMDNDVILKIVLGITYSIIYIISSVGSKGAYRIEKYRSRQRSLNDFQILQAIILFVLSFVLDNTYLVVALFLLIYLIRDIRKPIFVDVIDDNMRKDERATVLSVVSQIKSAYTVLLAPLMGFIADRFGIKYAMLALSAILVASFFLTYVKSTKREIEKI